MTAPNSVLLLIVITLFVIGISDGARSVNAYIRARESVERLRHLNYLERRSIDELDMSVDELLQLTESNLPQGIYIQPEKVVYFKHNESVRLQCIAAGSPPPTYRWKYNDIDYIPGDHGGEVSQPLSNAGTLVFNAPEEYNQGFYQCFADYGFRVSVSNKITLRMAKLLDFSIENTSPPHFVQAGDKFMLPCIQPISYPPALIVWTVHGPDEKPLDSRKGLAVIDGNLFFGNTKMEDGKAYVCHAKNFLTRTMVSGRKHIINIVGNEEKKFRPSLLYASPSHVLSLQGDDLELHCVIAGSPAPDVSWKKIGNSTKMPTSVRFTNWGMTMLILDIQPEDAGHYTCTGVNNVSATAITSAFDVRVEASPHWTDEPHDTHASIGETATIFCSAGGIPEPRYIWYINGVRLDEVQDERIHSRRFSRVNETTITLTDLTLDDLMNVQCNATNKHGYIFADVYLNVGTVTLLDDESDSEESDEN